MTFRDGEDWYFVDLPPRAAFRRQDQEMVDSIERMVHSRQSEVPAVHSRSSSRPRTPPKVAPQKKARPATTTILTARKSRGSVGQMLQQPQTLAARGSVRMMLPQPPAGPPPVVLTPASRCQAQGKQPVRPKNPAGPLPTTVMHKPSPLLPKPSPWAKHPVMPPKQPALPTNPARPMLPSARSSTCEVEVAGGGVLWEVEEGLDGECEQADDDECEKAATTSKSPAPPVPPWKLPPWRLQQSPRSSRSEQVEVAGDGVEEEGESDDECQEDTVLARWLAKGAWVCTACMSTNMRFSQICGCCLEWRADNIEMADDDWRCGECHNVNFAYREKCYWVDCPTNDWICPCCSNRNYGCRMKCNMHKCNADRPAIAAPEAAASR